MARPSCVRCGAVTSLMVMVACASGPRVVRSYPFGIVLNPLRAPPGEDERATFGTVAVSTPGEGVQVTVRRDFEEEKLPMQVPARRGGQNAHEALSLALECLSGSGSQSHAGIVLLCTLFAPVAAAVTGLSAATIAADTYQPASTAASDASAKPRRLDEPLPGADRVQLRDRLEQRIVERLRSDTSHPVTALGTRASQLFEQDATYAALVREQIGTVLEAHIFQIRLVAVEDAEDPAVGVFIQAHTRVLRPAADTQLYAADLEYRGAARKVSEWTADAQRLLADDLQRGCDALADKMVDEIFLLYWR